MQVDYLDKEYEKLSKLIVEGDNLIKRLTRSSKKEGLKGQVLDKLSYVQGLKSPADRLIKKDSDLSLKRAQNASSIFLEKASQYVETAKKVTKAPTFNFAIKKEGMIQNFANDLNIRMTNVDLDSMIKDLKRVNNSLMLKLRKLERQKKQALMDQQFEKMKKKIKNM